MKYRIVVAIRPEDAGLMREVMGDEFDLVMCTSLQEAQAALTRDVDMIACGVHFDDGRMFDLLKYVKAEEALRAIPFWGVLRDEGMLSSAITRGIRTAMKTLGANGLFNLSQMQTDEQPENPYRKLRATLAQSLAEGEARQS
ncbi:hypothetical protein [Noviherbaspirillum soli]|uniref:hypothetical protein n=1 Tax=Noviherbaspirillum soli TaxID=1064518 RepID=UPI00188B4C3A|nr:hypothetical protein [Noviherbaspirillum soli]